MNTTFLNSIEVRLRYELKEGTKGAFYLTSGPTGYLPKRLSVTKDVFARPKPQGRALVRVMTGQVKGDFTKAEVSKYKPPTKRPCVTFSLWRFDENSLLFGYADVGFRLADGKSISSGDLVAVTSPDNLQTILEVRIFLGCYPDTQRREAILRSIR